MIKELISEEELNKRIKELGEQITNEFKGEDLVLICVLNGAVYFATKLSQEIKNENTVIDFIKVSSYSGTESTGKVKLKLDLSEDIKNKNVIIIEDIVDTGLTLEFLCDYLNKRNPKTLKVCTMLNKKARREKNVKVNYVGFEIDNKFVRDIVYGVVDNCESIDGIINKYLEDWNLDRLGKTDKAILRIGTFEMLHYNTPNIVAINEAIELAKKYSDDKVVKLINATLDKIRDNEVISE